MTTLLTGLHGPPGRLLLVRLLDAGHVTGSATQADPGAGVFSAQGSIPPIRAQRLGQQPAGHLQWKSRDQRVDHDTGGASGGRPIPPHHLDVTLPLAKEQRLELGWAVSKIGLICLKVTSR